uniref:BAI1-associated protein 3 n=1 Tax=Timema bartmani TaxID=61472 RepID=A0A7R9EQW3_9NEOP|nr:unnamed protein product [Timema bartmani]
MLRFVLSHTSKDGEFEDYGGYIYRSYTRICVRGEWKTILEKTLSTPDRDSNLNIPVIGSLVYCESSALYHVATEVGTSQSCYLSGFSDPYCMLGIQPGNIAPPSPQPTSQRETPPGSPRNPANSRTLSDSGVETDASSKHDSPHEKLRKHHSFRLSFKRKEHSSYGRDRREHRDSISTAVPAKFIRATTVKPQTLNPRWNEKFRFDIDDVGSDILHLDIWDHDDESSVFDAVSKLNEVRGVKGLGRFFKQIAQSARSGSQDDFLGCVNVPLQDIPSTGLDCWYKLEARTQRSNIQGRIRLKLWLSTREDRGNSEEDNWSEIRQQERLHAIFINYELARFQGPSWEWNGELPHVALTILHQHAIQGDVTELQLAMVRWISYSRKALERPLDYRILYRLLQELDQHWSMETLSKEEEECLAESFNMFLDYSLQLLRKHRQLFLSHLRVATCRLDYLLRCMGLMSTMKAFWKCCPFNKEIRGEIIASLKKGTLDCASAQIARVESDTVRRAGGKKLLQALSNQNRDPLGGRMGKKNSSSPDQDSNLDLPVLGSLTQRETSALANYVTEACKWYNAPYEEIHSLNQPVSRSQDAIIQGLVHLITLLLVDLQKGYDHYHPLFETTNGVPYFAVVYKQLEKLEDTRVNPPMRALVLFPVGRGCWQRAGYDRGIIKWADESNYISKEIPRRAFKLHYPRAQRPFIVQPLIPIGTEPFRRTWTDVHECHSGYSGTRKIQDQLFHTTLSWELSLRTVVSATFVIICPKTFIPTHHHCCPLSTISETGCLEVPWPAIPATRVGTTNRSVYVKEAPPPHTQMTYVGVLAIQDTNVRHIAQGPPRQEFWRSASTGRWQRQSSARLYETCAGPERVLATVHSDLGPQVTALCINIQNLEIGKDDIGLPPGSEVATPIFELYIAMQEFVSFQEHIPPQDQKSLSINCYYQWFEPAVDKWLDVAKFKAMYRIRKAAELNKVCFGDLIVKHSTSAMDATSCFFQIKEFWRQLAWPDLVSSYNLVVKIIDIICSAAVYYADLTHKKLEDMGYYEETAPFKISDEMCVTVNDLEYVRRTLSMLGEDLHVEAVLEAVEAATEHTNKQPWRQALYDILDDATTQLEARALQVINRVAAKMRPALKKAMFHLAWSPDSLPTSEAINPLLEYLDAHLVSLNGALLPRNFERVLADVWEISLLELGQQMDGNAGDKVAVFYERLYVALEILVEFFHADQKGLPLEALKSVYRHCVVSYETGEISVLNAVTDLLKRRWLRSSTATHLKCSPCDQTSVCVAVSFQFRSRVHVDHV